MKAHKVGNDLLALKKNFHTHRKSIAFVSAKMFWFSIAVTVSFIVSQVYLVLFP